MQGRVLQVRLNRQQTQRASINVGVFDASDCQSRGEEGVLAKACYEERNVV